MIILSLEIWYQFTILGEISFLLIVSTIAPPSIYSFACVLGYSKREILLLISPSRKRGIFKTIKTFFTHPLDLIIVPAYVATILYAYMSLMDIDLSMTISIIAIMIYVIQILPLMLRRNIHIKASKHALNYVRDEIKITRIIFSDTTSTKDEREYALNRHIAAEEIMSVNSDFLVYTTGLSGTFIMVVRTILPVITGLGGQLLKSLFIG